MYNYPTEYKKIYIGMRMDNYQAEYNRITNELTKLQEKIENCPKGSLRRREIKGREYYYLQYRDGKHVRSRYVGHNEVKGLQIEIETRRELEEKAHK